MLFQALNYHPDAILNYLTTISGAFTDKTEGKSLNEMVSMVSLYVCLGFSAYFNTFGHIWVVAPPNSCPG